jgi:PTH1 family peptidyl-tRNA hydrolase
MKVSSDRVPGSQWVYEMKLVVGLGNPGLQYEWTRHNVGFQVVDALCTEAGASFKFESKYKGYFCKTRFKNEEVIFLKPDTYMNLSGESVRAISAYLKIAIPDILVIHDDVSFILGRVRLQQGGGAGGQHGIESIIECFGGKNNFDRLKVGVGPDPGGARRAAYVLSRVNPEDLELYQKSLKLASETAASWILAGGLETANRFNGINLANPLVVEPKPKVRPANEKETEALGELEATIDEFLHRLNLRDLHCKAEEIVEALLGEKSVKGIDSDELKSFSTTCLRSLAEKHRVHEQRWKKLIEQKWLVESKDRDAGVTRS